MVFEKKSNTDYRFDIDGLRAIAVLSVIGYHFFPRTFPGGFIGVDIFFVISGFLITQHIRGSIGNHAFSFADFYERRAKRIFPALIVVLLFCLAFGWFQLLPDEYAQLGKHTSAGALFVSNFVFLREVGYFDNAAETKPLLHLWSLGIEEQFYIFWPILLLAAFRLKLNLKRVCLTILAASFAYSVFDVAHNPAHAFFAPLPRCWELAIGALMTFFSEAREIQSMQPTNAKSGKFGFGSLWRLHDRYGAAAGLFLMLAGLIFFYREMAFPGFAALLPTVGASLIVVTASSGWARTVLTSRGMVWLGKISYPLYLWHWSLFSLTRVIQGTTPPVGIRVSLVTLSILLAWMTFRLVEVPIRFKSKSKLIAPILFAVLLLVGLFGFSAYKQDGYQNRFSAGHQQALVLSHYNYFSGKTEAEFWGTKSCFAFDANFSQFTKNHCLDSNYVNRPTVMLLGDSHAAYLAPGLKPLLDAEKVNFWEASSAYCEPLTMNQSDPRCADIDRGIFQTITATPPDMVIIFEYYAMHAQNYAAAGSYEVFLIATAEKLQQLGVKKVLLVGQIPTWTDTLPHQLSRKFANQGLPVPTRTFTGLNTGSIDFDARLSKLRLPNGVSYISLRDVLCDKDGCLTQVGDDLSSDLIVFDYGHLTQAGATYVAKTAIMPHVDAAF